VGIGVVVLVASFAPLPGYYNVTVTVSSYEVGVLVGAVFGITSVSGGVSGAATVLDWGGLIAHQDSVTWGVSLSWTMNVCLIGSSGAQHCDTKSTGQWFGSIPFLGSQLTATNNFAFAYIPADSYSIQVTLTGNGQSASGSGSVTVGG